MARCRWAIPSLLEPYLEHDGSINDEEFAAGPGAYLAQLADMGIRLSEDDPLVLGVRLVDGQWRASLVDGNHRLLLALADETLYVPFVVRRQESRHPGFEYAGQLGWYAPAPQMRVAPVKRSPVPVLRARRPARKVRVRKAHNHLAT